MLCYQQHSNARKVQSTLQHLERYRLVPLSTQLCCRAHHRIDCLRLSCCPEILPQILPDSGHMALMEGDVDLAAVMARSGFLAAAADADSRKPAEERPIRQQSHGGEAAAREALQKPACQAIKSSSRRRALRAKR